MTDRRVFISGMGVISPLGRGILQTKQGLRVGASRIAPVTLFSTAQNTPLPVGEVHLATGTVPRTHELALAAAREAMACAPGPPDAVVMGVTTGGMLTTETHLKRNTMDPGAYTNHGVGSVAETIAREFRCTGLVMTVSTACSSGGVAIKLALELLRWGKAQTVLVGGADALCKLTYYGFNTLQVVDPLGARPLDAARRGMSVAEGAAMLLLVSHDSVPRGALAEVLGAGISCDAHHPAAPHPEGRGAADAIRAALKDAGVGLQDVDYINLHGTGTQDNDLAEAKAVNAVFADAMPHVSSIKGATGHSLAAAGAIEAVISTLSIQENRIPANTRCEAPDPALNLKPTLRPTEKMVRTVLSNSFGFGGNNAAVIIGAPRVKALPALSRKPAVLSVVGSACITGAGNTRRTLDRFSRGKSCKGILSDSDISCALPPRATRRLKRLPRLALALAVEAQTTPGLSRKPAAVFLGTGWGALSETYDFLSQLYESHEQYSSPTDFVGSVHNAPAGQVAIHFGATGPNVTTTGGDASFEQALMAAGLLSHEIDSPLLVMGVDEYHYRLSDLFDRSVPLDETHTDGGGALIIQQGENRAGVNIVPMFFEQGPGNPQAISRLIRALGDADTVKTRYKGLLVGIPAASRKTGERQLQEFITMTGFSGAVIDYRQATNLVVTHNVSCPFNRPLRIDGMYIIGGKHDFINGQV